MSGEHSDKGDSKADKTPLAATENKQAIPPKVAMSLTQRMSRDVVGQTLSGFLTAQEHSYTASVCKSDNATLESKASWNRLESFQPRNAVALRELLANADKSRNLQRLDLSKLRHDLTDKDLLDVCTQFPHLKSLNLSYCNRITETGIQAVATLKNLTEFDAKACDITYANIAAIVKNNQNLSVLNLAYCDITNAEFQELAPLFKNLTNLDVTCCFKLTDTAITAIVENAQNLSVLKMHGSHVTEVVFLAVATLRNLTEFNASSSGITDTAVAAIVKNNTNLSVLKLSNCERISDFQVLATLRNLTEFDASGCPNLTDVSIAAIAKNNTNLSVLKLSNCERISDFQVLATLRNLTEFDASGCPNLTDVSIAAIAKNNTNLSVLKLSNCKRISDFQVLATLRNLTELDVRGCPNLTDVSIAAIAKNNQKLSSVSLGNRDGITDTGVATLKNLTEFYANGCQITDVGIEAIAKNNQKLSMLSLGNINEVTGIGFQALATLKNLTIFCAAGCRNLTDANIAEIAKNNQNLYMFALSNCDGVTNAGKERLREILPNAIITDPPGNEIPKPTPAPKGFFAGKMESIRKSKCNGCSIQ